MSERLYYGDAYTRQFTATIIEQLNVESSPAVILNRSYFYPTSGGQLNDLGRINGSNVIDVFVRDEDEAVVHVLDQPVEASAVTAALDWPRRFDHMQQHSGQHILSQAFIQLADAPTIGFHMGIDACTIDVQTSSLHAEQVAQVEALANEVVWDNRPIITYNVPKATADQYRLRKIPPVKGDKLRVVDVVDFDVNACGGTHVMNTGEIGLIKITKLERIRGNMRVEFRCGQRALRDYANRHQLLAQLSGELTCAPADVPHVVNNLRSDLKTVRKGLKKAQSQLLAHEASALATQARSASDLQIIVASLPKRDAAELQQLVNILARAPQTLALLGSPGPAAQLFIARSKTLEGHLGNLLRPILADLGGTGGGGPTFARGGGFSAERDELTRILERIQQEMLAANGVA